MLSPAATIEALLFVSGDPVEKPRIASQLSLSLEEVAVALDELRNSLEGRGITLIETEREVELRASAAAADLIRAFHESELTRDLGKASLETLAVIAYQAGTTRSEIEWVRGVQSSTSLRTLLMRGLIVGEEDPRDKRRIRYRLTTEALAHLGITRIQELPRFIELSRSAASLGKEIGTQEET